MTSTKNSQNEVTSIEANGVKAEVVFNTPRVRDGKQGEAYPSLAIDKLSVADADKLLGNYTTGTKGSILLDLAQATLDRNAKALLSAKGVGSDKASRTEKLAKYLESLPSGTKESETATLKKSMLSMADLVKRMMALSVETAMLKDGDPTKAVKQAELAALTAELSSMTAKLS